MVLTIIPSLKPFAADTASGLLPAGVTANWELANAYRETTPTREHICLNGLWRWRPAKDKGRSRAHRRVGLFQGSRLLARAMPATSRTVIAERSTFIPVGRASIWAALPQPGTRGKSRYRQNGPVVKFTWLLTYVNSFAIVFVDGKKVGEISVPGRRRGSHTVALPTRRQVPDHATRRGDAAQGCSTFLCRQ